MTKKDLKQNLKKKKKKKKNELIIGSTAWVKKETNIFKKKK